MSLYKKLQDVRSEEDVKDVYIQALGLKKYTKGLIDIRTKEMWFEAKHHGKDSSYKMFTQLLHYVQDGLNKGEELPPFLAVMDTEKAALMKTADVIPFLKKKTIKWGKSATKFPKEALDQVSAFIGTRMVSFRIATHEDEFISTVKAALTKGDIIRISITPDNLKQVFDKWVEMIGREIGGAPVDKYALLFFADIMHDGTKATHENLPAELLHQGEAPVFSLDGKLYKLGNREGYRQFWSIYHRPPDEEYRNYLLERRDSLIPLDERSFKGAFYTPLHVVDKAYDKLADVLGKNWQKNYIVWDMCCGVGNLETKHSNPRNVFMSTLDQADVDVMKATRTCVSATRFQYDYLNDDITADGRIDYSLTNKVPSALRQAIAEGRKILILINPPYAEAANIDNITSSRGKNSESKKSVSKTQIAKTISDFGYASRELFVQFLVRIAKEIPNATLAMFSTLKYVNAPNFEPFRSFWNASYLGGFLVPSKAFDGLNGNFPIGFLIWETDNSAKKKTPITNIVAEVLNKKGEAIGEKQFYNLPSERFLSNWIKRARSNKDDALPLKGALVPTTSVKDVRGTKWADGAIGGMIAPGGDVQHANLTALLSSGYCSAGGFFVTKENLWKSAVVFAVRRLVKPSWLNDRDQFLQPDEPLTEEFKMDCLIWMLFSTQNLTAGANGLEWNGRQWSLVNHFIPFTEAEVNAPDRFESDFMVQYLHKKKFSVEASAVLRAGKILWQTYFSVTDVYSVRQSLKLNRPDVGWYQIRSALGRREEQKDKIETEFAVFDSTYETLTSKLAPMIYDLGFLKT